MKKHVFLSILLIFFFNEYSRAQTATKVPSTGGQTISQSQAEKYNGPKARLAVGEFKDKTAGGGLDNYLMKNYGILWKAIGEGMRDMLTTALFNTNRYLILEREQLEAVKQEQDLGASGRVKKGTEAPVGEIYGAELLVTASITEFDAGRKAVKGGIEVRGLRLNSGVEKAHLAIDIRGIDTKTSQIVAATSVEGEASGIGAEGAGQVGGLPVSLGTFSKTPLEKAIRSSIRRAVDYIVSQTPKEYFRVDEKK